MNKRILFVDDEPNVLEGLRHRLRHRRRTWDMIFVGSGREALEIIGREPFDIIVSDMRMPEMDGATLLRRVRDEHPVVARLALSGHADERAMLQAMAVAHQFMSKPCDAGVLENVIERVCNLQALVNDVSVREAVGKIISLPSPPVVYTKLMQMLADELTSTADAACVLKQDGALCAQILHIVNSAYFQHKCPIVNIEAAVSFLGFNTVKQLALVAELFRQSGDHLTTIGISIEGLQSHALLVGGIASALIPDSNQKETVFIAGLLHDIGKLLMATELPDRLAKVTSEMRAAGGPMSVIEGRLYGVTHAEIGAYLLGLWQIPFPIVEAVANHHVPSRVEVQGFDALAAIHVANALATEQMDPFVQGAKNSCVELDSAFIEKLGVSDQLPGWRELAKERAQA